MSVITKRGDKGQTDMLGVGRVDKNDPRLEIYGDLDELSAAIGVASQTILVRMVFLGMVNVSAVVAIATLAFWLYPHYATYIGLALLATYLLERYYRTLLQYKYFNSVCVEAMEHLIKFGGDMSRVARGLPLPHDWETYNYVAEAYVHEYEAQLPQLRSWILPTGDFGAAELHLARAVCRRAERHYHTWAATQQDPNPQLAIYLNRLSDLLFTLARKCAPDHTYQP